MREKRNAIIESARLTLEDRDILTVWLSLDYGGTGQGFGGYSLLLGPDYAHRNEKGPNYAGVFIEQVLRIAGVQNWSDLVGRTIRADCDGGRVYGIGHIVKEHWFYPEEKFRQMEEAA